VAGVRPAADWAIPKPPAGFPTGHTTLYDTTLGWRFVNPRMEALGHTDALGQTAENLAQERYQVTPDENAPDRVAQEYRVSREAQDRFALGSHQKAIAAIDDKRFREEVSPVPVRTRKTDAVVEVDDLGLVELNEAFAAQVLAVLHEWKMAPTDERLNPNGEAIALGHPLGCSGARILTTLVHEMRRRPEVELGLATMCIGVGQGIAMVVEKVA
jgi:acetyl-CoA acetyltransferase